MNLLKISNQQKFWLKKHLPRSLVNSVREVKNSKIFHSFMSTKKMKNLNSNGNPVTIITLINDLRQLGLFPGMKVMLHSSLYGLGLVEGGAPSVIKAVLEVIGKDGLLVMPCHPITGGSVDSIKNGVPFDPALTACSTGKICETFRQWPGVFRSWHPSHSIAAIGPEAEWLVKDHHIDSTPFGVNSPYSRLLEINGYIVGIGLDVRWITFYHHFEDVYYKYPIRVYNGISYKVPVKLNDDSRILVTLPYHDDDVAAFRLNNDLETLAKVEKGLNKYGDLRYGIVGKKNGYIIKAKGVYVALEKMLEIENQTIYNLDALRKAVPSAIL